MQRNGRKYEVLLYHIEVRWLSGGKVVNCVIELPELRKFFCRKINPIGLIASLTLNESYVVLQYWQKVYERRDDFLDN